MQHSTESPFVPRSLACLHMPYQGRVAYTTGRPPQQQADTSPMRTAPFPQAERPNYSPTQCLDAPAATTCAAARHAWHSKAQGVPCATHPSTLQRSAQRIAPCHAADAERLYPETSRRTAVPALRIGCCLRRCRRVHSPTLCEPGGSRGHAAPAKPALPRQGRAFLRATTAAGLHAALLPSHRRRATPGQQ